MSSSSSSSTTTPKYQPIEDYKRGDALAIPLLSNKAAGSSSSSTASGGSASSASDTGNLHERDILPELEATNISDVIIESTILATTKTSREQADMIFKEFNKHVKPDNSAFTVTTNPFRGERLEPDEFWLGERNNITELARSDQGQKLAICYSSDLNAKIQSLGKFKITSLCYGSNGVYVVNVPRGKYAKVMINNRPKLLSQGPHVIHDQFFEFNPKTGLVDINEQQIQHGSIHCLRCPVGQIAKCYLGPTPVLLYARADGAPYIQDNVQFRVEGFVSQSEPYIAHGSIHIVSVPSQMVSKVWIGNEPRILQSQPTPYEFHSPRFSIEKFSANQLFFDALSVYIRHGPRHLLRVRPGSIAKVWHQGTQAALLEGRDAVYDFTDPLFRVADEPRKWAFETVFMGDNGNQRDPYPWIVPMSTPYISHGPLKRILVPMGKVCKITNKGEAQILQHQAEPYEFSSLNFDVVPRTPQDLYWDLNTPYLGHGGVHFVRVSSGWVAKVSTKGEAKLLESRVEPYIFNDLYFRLIPSTNASSTDPSDVFFNATDKLITHGALKRVIPKTGEVAITYQNGKLVILKPGNSQQPTVINDETAYVAGFLNVGVSTMVFPSDRTKNQRRKENANLTTDELNYEIFTTKDSLKVGVKLLVAFCIKDPELVVAKLGGEQGMLEHIENCSVVDLGRVTQQCTSQEFLTSYQNKPILGVVATTPGSAPSAPPMQHFSDMVRESLARDLSEYGIELVRLNFETPRILDTKIAEEMSKQSLQAAQVSAKEAVLNSNFNIARVESQQKAEVARISQDIENQNMLTKSQSEAQAKINAAKAELEAARLRAEAMVMTAESQKRVTILGAEAQQESLQMSGAQFHKYPALLALELAKLKTQYFQNAQVRMMVSPQELLSFVQSQELGVPTVFTGAGASSSNTTNAASLGAFALGASGVPQLGSGGHEAAVQLNGVFKGRTEVLRGGKDGEENSNGVF